MGYTSSTSYTKYRAYKDKNGNILHQEGAISTGYPIGTLDFGDFSIPIYFIVPGNGSSDQCRFNLEPDSSLVSSLSGATVSSTEAFVVRLKGYNTDHSDSGVTSSSKMSYRIYLATHRFGGASYTIILKKAEVDVTITTTDNVTYSAHFSWSGYVEADDWTKSTTTYKYYWLLSYDGNGGSGVPSSQRYPTSGESSSTSSSVLSQSRDFTIPSTIPKRAGHAFKGWAKSSSATTAQYQPGNSISITPRTNVTLYAVWEKTTPPLKTKVNGTWKDASDILVKVNGTWKTASAVYVKVNGTWKESK